MGRLTEQTGKSYLVESDVARSPAALEASRRARKMRARGAVLYVRSTYLPGDEVALHLFEAPSIEALEEAGQRAALDSSESSRRLTAPQREEEEI